jgi:multidrug efflux pump subunit AcrB
MERAPLRVATLALWMLAACKDPGPQPGDVAVVTLTMPGATAADAEARLLTPVEVAVAPVKGIYAMRGRAYAGGVTLDVTFERGVDMKAAAKAVRDAIGDQVQLPKNVDDLWVSLRIPTAVIARMVDHPKALFAAQRALERLRGIAGVAACGVREGQLVLELVPSALAARGLTMNDVVIAFERQLQPGRRATQDEIADTVVGAAGVRARDVAVITQRPDARCLVDEAADSKLPALLRVGVRSRRDRELVDDVLTKAGLVVVRDATTFAREGPPRRVTLTTGPVGPVVEAVILGEDGDAGSLAHVGSTAMKTMRAMPGVTAAWCDGCNVAATMRFEIDQDAADTCNIGYEKIAAVIRALTTGERVGRYFDGEREVDIVLGIEEGSAQWPQLPIRSEDGKIFPLSDLVRARETRIPRDFLHLDGRLAVAVYVRAIPSTSAAELLASVKDAGLGARVRVVPAGSVVVDSW